MKNVMLDLETMGNTPNSAIISIGAVKFDNSGLGEEFHAVVDLESSVSNNGAIDASTVLWWMGQSESARNVFKQKGEHINTVLQKFSMFLGADDCVIWGNGAAFDNVILASAYRNSLLTVPWKFWNDRCYRTMKSLYPSIKLNRIGVLHNALDDAKSQALHLIEILKLEVNNVQ